MNRKQTEYMQKQMIEQLGLKEATNERTHYWRIGENEEGKKPNLTYFKREEEPKEELEKNEELEKIEEVFKLRNFRSYEVDAESKAYILKVKEWQEITGDDDNFTKLSKLEKDEYLYTRVIGKVKPILSGCCLLIEGEADPNSDIYCELEEKKDGNLPTKERIDLVKKQFGDKKIVLYLEVVL